MSTPIDDSVSWQEHMERISKLGGKARSESLTPKQKSAIAKKGGKVGGKAAAASMTPEARRARAQKAAAESALVRQVKAFCREQIIPLNSAPSKPMPLSNFENMLKGSLFSIPPDECRARAEQALNSLLKEGIIATREFQGVTYYEAKKKS